MWECVEVNMPLDVAAVTTSVWCCPNVMLVGVMRRSFLAPPVLWGQTIRAGVSNLRKAPALLDRLQELLVAPLVYAEVETEMTRNADLLLFLGFTQLPSASSRQLFQRTI